jgi:hypothetical protein
MQIKADKVKPTTYDYLILGLMLHEIILLKKESQKSV